MAKYMLCIDKDGSPYLAHAFRSRMGNYNRQAPVKYIAKIGEGAKSRYFYTQDQLRAFQQGARQTVRNTGKRVKEIAKEKSGVNAKQRLDRAKKNNERAQKGGDYLIKSGTNTISKSIWEKDSSKSDKLFNEGIKRRNAGYNLQVKARDNLYKAQKEFDKTPLGKAQKVKDFASDIADDVDLALWDASKKAKILGKKVSDIADDAAFEVEYAGKKAVQKVTGAEAKKARDKALEDEKQFRRNAEYGSESKKWLNEYYANNAKEYAEKMDREYKSSLAGKLESTSDRMKEEFKKKQKEHENKKQKQSDGTIEETVIKENIIPETVLKENIIPETVLKENIIPETVNKENVIRENKSYKKKPDPTNASGVIPYDVLIKDAKEAGIDTSDYKNASRNKEKIAKQLMREQTEKSNSSGYQSLYSSMWYESPEYKKAVAEEEAALEKLKKQLYY